MFFKFPKRYAWDSYNVDAEENKLFWTMIKKIDGPPHLKLTPTLSSKHQFLGYSLIMATIGRQAPRLGNGRSSSDLTPIQFILYFLMATH